MTPMILGNNEEKIVNYSIRVIHQEDNKVKVVVVDKNNGDKIEGVIAYDVPTGSYVDCDLTARLHVDYTDAVPTQVEGIKKYRTVRLLDIKGNNIANSTVLVVEADDNSDSILIGLRMEMRMFIDHLVKAMNNDIPNFAAADYYVSSTADAFILYGDLCSQILYIEDIVGHITYKISYDDIRRIISSKFGGEVNV